MRTDHVYRVMVPTVGLLLLVIGCSAPGDGRILVEAASPTPVLNTDLDGDGSYTFDGDCDDNDPSVYPDAAEGTGAPDGLVGDGKDNDCDNVIDEGTLDYDDDADGVSETAGDCDDTDPSRYPGRTDGCDGLDNDCDGQVDENAVDAYEPNELPETASNLSDMTCKSTDIQFNLWPSTVDSVTDTDFYKLQVRASASCDFGITASVSGTAEQTNLEIKLYRDESGVPKLKPWTTNTQSTVNGVKIYTVSYQPANGETSGTYYLEVTAPDSTQTSCQDDTVMTISGEVL